MRRLILILAVSMFAAAAAAAQAVPAGFDLSGYGVRIEPDKRLMTVLATLEMATEKNAAGETVKAINTPLADKDKAFRDELLADNAALPADLRARISTFVTQYKRRHPKQTDAEIVAPFITMAYSLTPAPDLQDPAVTTDLPGSLLDVLDFAPLVREFYRRSTFASHLDGYVREYQLQSDSVLRPSAREMVSELLDYLHTRPRLIFSEKTKVAAKNSKGKATGVERIEVREHDRHFFIVPERLAPRGEIHFVNVRDDYYVIVPTDTDLSSSQARRAFLQFVVDPLVLSNTQDISAMRDWVRPLLDEQRKTDPNVTPDVFLTVARSLVAAIDIREAEYAQERIATAQARQKVDSLKTDTEKKAVAKELEDYKHGLADEAELQLYEDYQDGAVLDLYFADQLKGLEDSGFDIASSLREMIASFDGAKATARVTGSAEARQRAATSRLSRKSQPAVTAAIDNPVTTKLLEIQKSIEARDLSKAETDLRMLAKSNPADGRIYYNLGRVAGLQAEKLEDPDARSKKLIEAKNAYAAVLTAQADKALLSLTYVALARIYEFFDENSQALALYNKALELDRVKGGAYEEAFAAKQRLIRNP